MPEKKSDDVYLPIPAGTTAQQMQHVVAAAAEDSGLYISHIGSYSRTKYPNSVHWHFKRDAREAGLIDATFWDVKSLFWLMIRHREPQWVKDIVPRFQQSLKRHIRRLENSLAAD